MANDKTWEVRTNEWIEMTQKSRQRKEAAGKSRQRTETNLTELEHQQNPKPYKSKPHDGAHPPREPNS